MDSFINLPQFLEVKDTINGRGVFTKEPIERGKRIFASKAYACGVGGATVEHVRLLCHHCLMRVRGTPVVCSDCQVVGYCSKYCLDAALPLHAIECKGLVQLEKLRGDSSAPHTVTRDDHTRYWPPPMALVVARAINKRILSENGGDDPITYLACNEGHSKMAFYPYISRYVRILVPSDVSDFEIYQTFCAASVNAADVSAPTGTSAMAIYFEYSLINHMCKSNCGWEQENGSVSMYALSDIEAGVQLGISYLIPDYYLNVREVRRKKLKENFGFDCHCFICLGEETVGSELWLLDQQKRSLTAPWSHAMAQTVMEKGWELLCKGRRTSLTPLQVIQMIEPAVEVQRLVLDKHNIILILTGGRLVCMYAKLGEYEKAVKHLKSIGEVGTSALIQYGTVRDVVNISSEISSCLLKLGKTEEGMKLAGAMHQLFPKVPSTDALLDVFMDHGFEVDTHSKAGRDAAEAIEEALNCGSLNLPDGVSVENFRTSLQCSIAGIEPPEGLRLTDKPVFIPLIPGADGKLMPACFPLGQ